jgi:ABC-type microcin C transport system duplicated ATPase subunit YejF
VAFSIPKGTCFGIAGNRERMTSIKAYPSRRNATKGTILFEGKTLLFFRQEIMQYRRRVQPVFRCFSSIDPNMRS